MVFFSLVEHIRKTRELAVDLYLETLPQQDDDFRGWWNHSGTGAYSGDWERTCKELAASGYTAVLPNMLWGGLAHYPSEILPVSGTCREYGDQIAQCVEAAHRHGIEVHVWKVNWNLSTAPKDFIRKMQAEGRTQVTSSGEITEWLCPSNPENQKLELESMLEVAKKYDVDGLHFDYIRYPNSDNCFCDGCRARFEAQRGKKVENWPAYCRSGKLRDEYNAFRREQITNLVRNVSHEAKKIRPDIKISAAVFGSWPDCGSSVAQDWPHWAAEGYVDFLCPMDYTESDSAFTGLVRNQLEVVDGRVPVYPGIGVTASNSTLPADRVAGQIHILRELGARGFTLFNLSGGTAKTIVPQVRFRQADTLQEAE